MNTTLSQSLLELSDALEKLALALQQQKQTDAEARVRDFSVVVKKFTKAVTPQVAEADARMRLLVKHKHRKNFLLHYLKQQKTEAHSSQNHLRVDNYLCQLTDYLVQHYDHLKDFYRQFKSHLARNANFNHVPRPRTQAYIRQWCNMLKQRQLIDSFSTRQQGDIFVDINEIHQAKNFINGQWLEIHLRAQVARYLRQHIEHIQCFDILSQVHIIKPNGEKSELDLLLMLNNKIYWFECKSGNLSDYYERFADHRKLLASPPERSFVVVPESNDVLALNLKTRSGMTTLAATEMPEKLPVCLTV